MIEKCYEEAKDVLRRCTTKYGFYASTGYKGVWARDSVITSLGASLVPEFKHVFKRSLITLAQYQGRRGQIPNAVLKLDEKTPQVDFQSIDSSLWYIIGHYIYRMRYNDDSLFRKYKKSIDKALQWIEYQDIGNDGMPAQQPTTDWQDAFPHKYGHTINTQALYYKAVAFSGDTEELERVRHGVNDNEGLRLWQDDFYAPYRWKNHGPFKEIGDWFDSLGNLLAIVFDLADDYRAKKILDHIKRNKIADPVPIKAIFPPIAKDSQNWHDYFEQCEARTPYSYLNAGVWTYIGCFYVLALIKTGKLREARSQLVKIARANLKGGFNEWYFGNTGEPSRPENVDQAWNAGMYILAYESLKKKKVLI